MDPVSILEFTCSVLALSQKLYKFFKAIHDAPEEIREYLSALETVRRVFVDIQEYVEMYQISAFAVEDGMRLRVIEPALKDCELEFSFQLSYVESLQPEQRSSIFTRSKKQGQWVLNKDTIKGLTKKLEKLQRLLSLAVTTSTGKNDVLLRQKLEAVCSKVCKVSESHETEVAERQSFLLGLQQYGSQIQRGISVLLQVAQEANIRSDAGLDDLADSLAEDNRLPTSTDPIENDQGVQCNVSLVKGQSQNRDVVGQPVAIREIESGRHVVRPMNHGPAESFDRRSAMEQAFKAYKVKDDLNSTGIIEEDAHTWADLQAVPHPEDKYLAERIYRVGSTIVGIHISDQVDSIIGSSTQVFVACDCIRMILKMAAIQRMLADSMIESLTEMSDAIQTCERRLVLYKGSKLQDLFARLYIQLFEILKIWRRYQSEPGSSRMLFELHHGDIRQPMAVMRWLSRSVLPEIDLQVRVEQRETSLKIADMQIEQRKILTTLKDQRRILKSLQEERRIIGVVQEQQKILQIVQQIQGAMQMRGTSEQASS